MDTDGGSVNQIAVATEPDDMDGNSQAEDGANLIVEVAVDVEAEAAVEDVKLVANLQSRS